MSCKGILHLSKYVWYISFYLNFATNEDTLLLAAMSLILLGFLKSGVQLDA